MSPDAARIAEARSWLVKAASDLRAAIHEFTATPPLLDDIAFHTQQAVEKTLKGFLASLRRHRCLAGASPSKSCPLTEYAWRFRYPGEPEEPSPDAIDGSRAKSSRP